MAAAKRPAARAQQACCPAWNYAQPWVIDRADCAHLLAAPERFRFIAPFLGRAESIRGAADQLGTSAPRVRYWVARALAAGLLREETPGADGSARYRIRSDLLFLPSEMTEAGTTEALAVAWSDPWQRLLIRSVSRVVERAGPVGLRLRRGADGVLDYRLAHGPTRDIAFEELPPMSLGWITDIWLDDDQARALQRELHVIVARHAGKRSGPQRFIMRLALAPLIEPDIVSMQRTPPPPPARPA
jgi:hypothetical protein